RPGRTPRTGSLARSVPSRPPVRGPRRSWLQRSPRRATCPGTTGPLVGTPFSGTLSALTPPRAFCYSLRPPRRLAAPRSIDPRTGRHGVLQARLPRLLPRRLRRPLAAEVPPPSAHLAARRQRLLLRQLQPLVPPPPRRLHLHRLRRRPAHP